MYLVNYSFLKNKLGDTMKNKKLILQKHGFTLIELLAVIIILAVIALIATPIVFNVIDNVKENAFKSNINGLLETIRLYTIATPMEQVYELRNGHLTNEKGEELPYRGDSIEYGMFYVNEDFSSSVIVYNNHYCGKKSFASNNITVTKVASLADCDDSYEIGDSIVLSDGSEWNVLKDSKNGYVTLLSRYNLKYENNQFVQDSTDNQYASVNGFVFDEANHRDQNDTYCTATYMGCNKYEKDNATVFSDSSIKQEIDKYKQQLLETSQIPQNSIVRLITLDELENVGCDSNGRLNVGNCHNAPQWITSTASYWTMEGKSNINTNDVWYVGNNRELSYDMAARITDGVGYGLRPVIEIPKVLLEKSNNSQPTEKPDTTYAVWIWYNDAKNIIANQDSIQYSVNLLKENKINTIYLSLDPDNIGQYKGYIEQANKNNIRVYALFGDPNFIFATQESDIIKGNMDKIAQFNNAYDGIAHIEGIHYDVEYWGAKKDGQACPEGQSEEAKRCFAKINFVEFTRKAKEYAVKKNLLVEYDLTVYTTNLTTFYDTDGVEKNVLDAILPNVDGITLMTYGNSPKNTCPSIIRKGDIQYSSTDPVLTVDKTYIEKINEYGIELIVGQEIPVFKNTYDEIKDDIIMANTYFPEYQNGEKNDYIYNKEFISRMMYEIRDELTSNSAKKVGFAFHDYNWLVSLIES